MYPAYPVTLSGSCVIDDRLVGADVAAGDRVGVIAGGGPSEGWPWRLYVVLNWPARLRHTQ